MNPDQAYAYLVQMTGTIQASREIHVEMQKALAIFRVLIDQRKTEAEPKKELKPAKKNENLTKK